MTKSQFDSAEIVRLANRLHARQIKWRRQLHSYPEIANEEFKTTSFLKTEAKKLPVRVLPLDMPTGLLLELEGASGGPTVAIRTDIDALPVTEKTGLSFASRIPGRMHACGHDVHTATVLGTAALLCTFKKQLAGRVRFIFQPAEEKPPGGARPMIENRALDDVGMILGLHVDPRLPTGRISLRDGPTMAAVYDFDLIIKGKAGHAARPHDAIDAIVTASEVVESLQKVISREIDPISPVVLTFGKIEGGLARNVIAEEVRLEGTARTLSPAAMRRIPGLIKRTVNGICRARGADSELVSVADYPVVRNNPKVNQLLKETYTELFPKKKIETTEQVLGGEDFACYLDLVPGAMFRLGTQNKKIGADQPWHSSKFIVDEAAIPYGTALLAAAALRALENLA
ncbi:MAG: amidohydrolase [candidate division Zixibacteria bacterium]